MTNLIYPLVVNVLILSLPVSWYMCFQMYKDLKNKDEIIKLQDKIIKNETTN